MDRALPSGLGSGGGKEFGLWSSLGGLVLSGLIPLFGQQQLDSHLSQGSSLTCLVPVGPCSSVQGLHGGSSSFSSRRRLSQRWCRRASGKWPHSDPFLTARLSPLQLRGHRAWRGGEGTPFLCVLLGGVGFVEALMTPRGLRELSTHPGKGPARQSHCTWWGQCK